MTSPQTPSVALVTGGSSGLGLALARALDDTGWIVVNDARNATRLRDALEGTTIHGVPGDVGDADHRAALVDVVTDLGGLDLLVLGSSTLGPLPMRPLAQFEPEEIGAVFRENAGAPGSLMIALTDQLLRRDGVVVGISSDAAVQHYETWGAYGASKAALDHLVLTFGAETGLTTYAVDPGDMRTPMQQDAFPGEDISDRPLPETVVPRLLALLEPWHHCFGEGSVGDVLAWKGVLLHRGAHVARVHGVRRQAGLRAEREHEVVERRLGRAVRPPGLVVLDSCVRRDSDHYAVTSEQLVGKGDHQRARRPRVLAEHGSGDSVDGRTFQGVAEAGGVPGVGHDDPAGVVQGASQREA